MTQGRMTSLIKPGRIQNQEIATCDLRPITVLNVWWRCWAGAWAHCISMKHYAKALPPFVSGIHQRLGAEESATILQDAFVNKNGFLSSLDYKQMLNANSSSSFLQKIGFPTSITSLIQQVWNTQRTVQYGQSLSRKVLQSNCTPQGCPLAPITLVSWMVSGHFFVQQGLSLRGHTAQAVQQAVTGIYMDDRSVVDSDLHRSIDRVDTWAEWSSRVQLRENLDKIQAVAKQQRQQAILQHEKPEWAQHSEVKVLGVTITNKRRELESGKAKVRSCPLTNQPHCSIAVVAANPFCCLPSIGRVRRRL